MAKHAGKVQSLNHTMNILSYGFCLCMIVIQFVQAKMGVTPGWGGAAQLVELLGKQQALKILTSSQKIFSQEALNIGLADGVISNESVCSKLANIFITYISCNPRKICDWLLSYLTT